ncbi:hypothetical protein D9M71_732280 [compost metagenome]
MSLIDIGKTTIIHRVHRLISLATQSSRKSLILLIHIGIRDQIETRAVLYGVDPSEDTHPGGVGSSHGRDRITEPNRLFQVSVKGWH